MVLLGQIGRHCNKTWINGQGHIRIRVKDMWIVLKVSVKIQFHFESCLKNNNMTNVIRTSKEKKANRYEHRTSHIQNETALFQYVSKPIKVIRLPSVNWFAELNLNLKTFSLHKEIRNGLQFPLVERIQRLNIAGGRASRLLQRGLKHFERERVLVAITIL